MTTPKRPRGRPPTTGRGHDGPRITVRFTAAEMEQIDRAAAARHLTAATYLREVGLDAAGDTPDVCGCGRAVCDRRREACHVG